jgi:DNA adenine methylase
MKPPMPYAGGKQRLAGRIVALMPDHLHYVEPFAGALGVLLVKPPSRIETVNDLDGEIVTFWWVQRDDPQGLHRMCVLTPRCRDLYMGSRVTGQGGTDLEIVWRVWVRLTQGRGSRRNAASGWRFVQGDTTRHALARYLDGYCFRLIDAAERLRMVSIEHMDALRLIASYDRAETLFGVDPPHWDTTRHAGMHTVEMGALMQHSDLLHVLKTCTGKIVLSGYRSELYDVELADWTRIDLDTTCMTGEKRTESLWINYQPSTLLWGCRRLSGVSSDRETLALVVDMAYVRTLAGEHRSKQAYEDNLRVLCRRHRVGLMDEPRSTPVPVTVTAPQSKRTYRRNIVQGVTLTQDGTRVPRIITTKVTL